MAINFPPTDDQTPDDGSFTYTDPGNGQEYSWNGFGWDLVCSGGGGGGADVDHTHTLWHGDTNPTVGPDGDPLEVGQIFLNTSTLNVLVWVGGSWLAI